MMSMQPREKIMVYGGLAVVIVAGLVRYGPGLLGGRDLDSLITQVETHGRLRASVAALSSEMGIELPRVELIEQERNMRGRLAEISQRNGMRMGTLKRVVSRGSRRGATEPVVRFQFDVTGKFNQYIAFLHALENDEVPFVVEEATVQTAQRGENNPRGEIRSTLTVKGFLFEEFFPEDPEERERRQEERRRANQQAPEAGPEQPEEPESAPDDGGEEQERDAEADAGEAEAAQPEATPMVEAIPSERERRLTIRHDQFEARIEGNVAYITLPDGSTMEREFSDEEFEQMMEQIPPEAEVIEE